MIGVVYEMDNNIYEEQNVANKLCKEAEKMLFIQLNKLLDTIKSKNKDFKLIHWSHFEPLKYNKIANKYNLPKYDCWYDLHKIFIENNIVLPGMFNFKLKTVGNLFYKNKLIKSKWIGDVKDGYDSIGKALLYYKTKEKKILESIKKYNLVDCKVMKELYEYLTS